MGDAAVKGLVLASAKPAFCAGGVIDRISRFETAQEVFAALRTANRELGATIVIVTHDSAVSGQVARTVAIRDGRTSSEVLRSHDDLAAGAHAVGEEYAVMDRAGRVQVPREFREALALTRRVRLALEQDHVEIRSDGDPR